MEQTFNDLCRERAEERKGLFGLAVWVFIETSSGIIGENMTTLGIQNRNILRIAIGTGLLLMVPLVAMQLTEDVVWGPLDFLTAFGLLFGTGASFELLRRRGGMAYRLAAGIGLAASLLLVWANLAVGIIGDEGNPENLLFFAVPLVGIIGAAIAHFQAQGMARTLFVMAITHVLATAIAVAMSRFELREIMLNGIFTALFVASALLFRRAAQNSD
ncbi:MAG TPA: hypothetical protein VFW45_15365 [Candidatus Polarisedimenticolia bacterium]|nr:hypothetical protein [Candidatus Polarisedimenticolia bacterium]